MKYFINELIKTKSPFKIEETCDFSALIENHPEIRKISPVTITGKGELSGENVVFKLNIKCDLILPCALTLDDVLYPLDINTIEYFTFNKFANESDYDYDINIVKGQVIELAPVIWQNIIVNLPLRVVSEYAYEKLQRKGDNWQIIDEDEMNDDIDPRFAKLKDLLKNKEEVR